MTRPLWSDELHEFVDWAEDLAFEAGYRRGLADAAMAMDRSLAAALTGSSFGLGPASPSAKEIVRRLARVMAAGVRT